MYSLLLAGAARSPNEHASETVEGHEVPVRPLPELLFDRRLVAVYFPAVRANVLRFEDTHGEVEPRAVMGDRTPKVLGDELNENHAIYISQRGCGRRMSYGRTQAMVARDTSAWGIRDRIRATYSEALDLEELGRTENASTRLVYL